MTTTNKVSTVKIIQMIGVAVGVIVFIFGVVKVFVLDNYKIGELEAADITITLTQKEHKDLIVAQKIIITKIDGKIDTLDVRQNAQGKLLEKIWDEVRKT